jgi:hypothetical protein
LSANRPARPAARVLSIRELNRAALERQLLLRRARMTAAAAIEHLVGLQGQLCDPPHLGLWTRLTDFTPPDLEKLLEARLAVRAGLMRATLHVIGAADYALLRPALQPVLERAQRGFFGRHTAGIDLPQLCAAGRQLLEEEPLTNKQLRSALAQRLPGADPAALQFSVHYLLPIVQVPPAGFWGAHGSMAATTAESWLGTPIAACAPPHRLILRYLAAFGPACVQDVQAWSGLTRLREVLDELRSRLRCFRDEAGRELFDLPDAPRPAPDLVAPVRFLPEYDNLMVAYKDRSRVLADEHRALVSTGNAAIRATVLVDGFVAGRWSAAARAGEAVLTVESFRELPDEQQAAIVAEGRELLGFMFPENADRRVEVAPCASARR